MKILYFLAHPHSIGGASKQLLEHAILSRAGGNEVLVIIQDDDAGNHNEAFDLLCNEREIDFSHAIFPVATCVEEIDYIQSLHALANIEKIALVFRPELIHSVQINLVAEMVARKHKVTHLMNIYQLSEGMFNIRWSDVFPQYHCGDASLYCAQWAKGLGITSRCIRVTYETENKKLNFKKDMDQNAIIFVCVGIFAYHKRQLMVLRMLRLLLDEGKKAKVLFLGNADNEYGTLCREYARQINVENHVRFEGEVLHIERFFRNSDALIHASISESYPGVIVEAMANGLPVISTPVAGVPEIVVDEKNGYLSKGYELDELINAVRRFLRDKEDKRLGFVIDNAFSTYEKIHKPDVIKKALIDYYEEIHIAINEEGRWEYIKKVNESILAFYANGFEAACDYSKRHIWFLYHLSC